MQRRSSAPTLLGFAALAILLAAMLLTGGCGGDTTTTGATTVGSATSTETQSDYATTTTTVTTATPTTAASKTTATGDGSTAKGTTAIIETTLGSFTVALDPQKAPATVKNFIEYAKAGFYDGTVFHRVIPGFMAQGGGFTSDLQQKPTNPPVANEAGNGLKNVRGTIAMARTGEVDSATSQFFINVVDNPSLDHVDDSQQGFGYAVFGTVAEGMDVVDKIVAVPTTTVGPLENVPTEPVVIKSVTIGG
jgi:peptidyl-prolyl cis-trans isomerase A (cyclophilin A)